MARRLTCPTITSIDSLRARAYKLLKATPYTRQRAYRAARHALDQAVKAQKYVEDAGKSDPGVAKQYCTWARWAYNDAKGSYANAQRSKKRYTRRR